MRVLIAEDDSISRRLLQSTLTKWGYKVTVCCDGSEAWNLLQDEDAPRLVILDWMMPGMDGLQLCREIRCRKQEPYAYVLLLTAKTQKQDIVAGMEAGADDYLTKPFDSQELKVRVRAGQRILDLQSELIRAREALRIEATRDPLTGLYNRGMIMNILEREINRADRLHGAVGVIMVDLDHFKDINDTYGHQVGDCVLKDTARQMTESMRSYDSIGRYGGEEFLIVAPGVDGSSAGSVAERLRSHLAANPAQVAGLKIVVTCSLGVAISGLHGTHKLETLIRNADRALYRAKESGRNRVELAF